METERARFYIEKRESVKGSDYPTHCSYGPVDDEDPFLWEAAIMGPPGSPYEDGVFFLSLKLSENYPISPPTIKFVTKVYHPNIDEDGTVHMDILEEEWTPALCLETLLLSVTSLLADPNPVDSLNPTFYRIAREWTRKYAM